MVRQCRLSGRRVPGSGFCVWRSDSNRYSGSALASCLPCWLCQLMHYSTHLTRKRELSYTTTDRALDARMALVASSGFRLVQCSFLLCRYEKAHGVYLGLEFLSSCRSDHSYHDIHVFTYVKHLVDYELSFSTTEGDGFIPRPTASVSNGLHSIFNISQMASHRYDFSLGCRYIKSRRLKNINQANC